jgi:hypothetical protein
VAHKEESKKEEEGEHSTPKLRFVITHIPHKEKKVFLFSKWN